MFGVIGMAPEIRRRCRDIFSTPWKACEIEITASATIGGHSHVPGRSILRDPSKIVVADGEVSLYSALGAPATRLWTIGTSGIELTGECRGNLAVWNETVGLLTLATEWTGSFPLYYAHCPNKGFVFASRMGVIAAAIRPAVDGVGLTEFLRDASFQSNRSLWVGVHRLQPGQSLEYDATLDRVTIVERSRLWTSVVASCPGGDHDLEEIWSRLGRAVDCSRPTSIMMSGGWDSRTLLARAATLSAVENLLAYSHGDPVSRETHIARQLSYESGIAFHQEPIDHRCYDLQLIRQDFECEEHIVFPHWHRAGRIAASGGHRVVTAGVYGEVLGGHYGRAMLLQRGAKIREVLRGLFRGHKRPADASPSDLAALKQFLRLDTLDRPWPMLEDWWRAEQVGLDQVNADIEHDVSRLTHRGVHAIDQLIEAYVSEHRGSQYINAQVRSCRAYTDVSLPFAERALLEAVSAIPLGLKIHNRINQKLLRQFAPALLRYPLAATLAAARRPLMVQEASRFVRKGLELGQSRAHVASGGRIGLPHLSWVNFDFLRGGVELRAVINDLRSDLWDKPAMLARVAQLGRDASLSPHSMADQLMKVYTIDLALRSA